MKLKTLIFSLAITLLGCGEQEPTRISTSTTTGTKSSVTEWTVTNLSRSGQAYITPANASTFNIYFILNKSGKCLFDNALNECGGKFTTDNKSLIDFDDVLDCTKVCCDPEEFTHFKEVLTKFVSQYSVNADTTSLRLFHNSETFILLKRVK